MNPSSPPDPRFDVIVIGARCAGSPLAMLLARQGFKVLVVDRATFPSDTLSTHLLHPPGVAALDRWGLLGRLAGTGCPAIGTYSYDLGPFTLAGSPGIPGAPVAYAPRRTVLDKLLVDAAAEAGAEVREHFMVEQLTEERGRITGIRGRDSGGRTVTETARVVVGADGRHSLVARLTRPAQYNQRPEIQAGYYTYFSGVPATEAEFYDRPSRALGVWPTHDGLTLVAALWPYSEFASNRRDLKSNFFAALETAPELADRVRAGTQEGRLVGGGAPNYFRQPYGDGWALVGDAGYNKDFITAHGIQDAFRDAELCAAALDRSLSGELPYSQAMAEYQSVRDNQALAFFEFTCEQAALQPAPPEIEEVFAAMYRNQEATDHFLRVFAGAASPEEFFAPDNVEAILAAARSSMVARPSHALPAGCP